MNPWVVKATVLGACVALVVIRAPHGHRSQQTPIAANRRGGRETTLLVIAWISFFLPLLWVLTPLLNFADYPLHPAAFWSGAALLALGLWLLYRSHADLGTNWSITLQVREGHRLIAHGVYRRVRHPMYQSLILIGMGMALVLPNAVAGPAYLVAMLLLFAFRVGPEEQMMRDAFGPDYDAYAARTKRLIPGIW